MKAEFQYLIYLMWLNDLNVVTISTSGCGHRARLAYEVKIVSKKLRCNTKRANGEEVKDVHDWSIHERPLLPQLGQRDTLD